MSNPNKARGSAWELAVRRQLHHVHGLDTTRPWQEGHEDTGDMHVEGMFAGQAKNYANVADALRNGVEGALRQSKAAGLRWGVAFVKRRGKGAGEGYAVMRIDDWAEVVREMTEMRRRLRSVA